MNRSKRTVFFVSDGTAITAETLGHSLLTQFPDVEFQQERLPFIDSATRAAEAVARINRASERDGARAIVFNTVIDEKLCEVILGADALVLDLFGTFMGRLERALGTEPLLSVGQAHGVIDVQRYEDRMEATNYALSHDDGLSIDFKDADLVLVGVSRSGKTPTCLYMALHFGVKAGNYPLTPEDLDQMRLPSFLRRYKRKIVGLMIDPDRLSQIRETRKPGSRYASIRQCRQEVGAAESLFRMEGIPVFHTTHSSIEEICSRVLMHLGLQREMF